MRNGDTAVEFGKLALGYMRDELGFARSARKNMPKKIQTPEDVETALQFESLVVVTRDRLLTAARALLAMDLGYAFAREDEDQIAASTEAGAQLVQIQAGSATQALLVADRLVARPADRIGEEVSVYQRAKDAFAEHPRVKPPVNIDDKEGSRFDELAERMLDMTRMAGTIERPKISRFRVVNLARVTRQSVHTMRESNGMTGTAIVRDVLESPMFPVIPFLDGKDTGDAHRTMRRKIRYFQGAARLDPELATHPIVRNYVYLFDKLGGRDVSSVKQDLQRDAKKVRGLATKQIQKAEQQAEIAEASDEDLE
ncbi:MAG: hypothetical protein ACXWLH_03095 [Candidatus Saccharimonadales bacterium]